MSVNVTTLSSSKHFRIILWLFMIDCGILAISFFQIRDLAPKKIYIFISRKSIGRSGMNKNKASVCAPKVPFASP